MLHINTITARDIPDAWFQCLRQCLQDGRDHKVQSGSFIGETRKQFDYVTVQITHPGSRPLVPDVPKGVPAPTDMAKVEEYTNTYLMSAEKQPGESYTYGEDIVAQIPRILEIYEQGHNTNIACMSIGGPHSINIEHSQCLRLIDTRVCDGALHFFVYFRSWDLWSGFPQNLAGLQLVKESMAKAMWLKDGELIAASKGLHLYGFEIEPARLVVRMGR